MNPISPNEATALQAFADAALDAATLALDAVSKREEPVVQDLTAAAAKINGAINILVRMGFVDAGKHDVIAHVEIFRIADALKIVLPPDGIITDRGQG